MAPCLTLLARWGPFQLQNVYISKLLNPSFYFDREEDNRIRLEIQFDYGDRKVSSRQELEELPFE